MQGTHSHSQIKIIRLLLCNKETCVIYNSQTKMYIHAMYSIVSMMYRNMCLVQHRQNDCSYSIN